MTPKLKRSTMAAMVGLAAFTFWPAALALGQETAPVQSDADATPKRPPAHHPAHITVRPLVRSYPGPDAVRQCAFWLATEYRPSGTVIVPRQQCWWERG